MESDRNEKIRLTIGVSPHQKANYNTSWVMKQVIIGLIPAIIASIIFFSFKALILILVCIIGCVFSEGLVNIISRKITLNDFSAVVTGILLALVLPPQTPWTIAVIGSIFAIIIVKFSFGGLGCNIFNPALGARAFLMAAFPVVLTTWQEPSLWLISHFYKFPNNVEATTSATPLAAWKFNHISTNIGNLFWGNVSGSLGETSAIAIIIGGLYIIIRKVADWRAPLGMFISIVLLSPLYIYVDKGNIFVNLLFSVGFSLFSGGVMLGMFFMITDPVTSPVTKSGRFIFGFLIGIMVFILRKFSGYPEGVMFSILFMNAFVPLINKLTKPKSFGR